MLVEIRFRIRRRNNYMKVAIAQLNFHVGNFDLNTRLITDTIKRAKKNEIDMVVFSELAVCGYPPLDLLENRDFIEKTETCIEKIASYCDGIAAIIGAPVINQDEKGKKLFNAALFLADKKVSATRFKTLLPTYDVFDEYRYFEPNTGFNIVEYKGERIALTICEDLWDDQPVENSFAKNKLYRVSPMEYLMKENPTLIINIASSPFSWRQIYVRETVLSRNARKYGLPVIYVNQVGGNTELIFDGGSLFMDRKGDTCCRLARFSEDYAEIDTENRNNPVIEFRTGTDHIPEIYNALILGIRDYFRKTGFTKATLGLSGGIDSAVTACLAAQALGNENVRVLLLPSAWSSEHSVADAKVLAENLGIQYDVIPIQTVVDAYLESLKELFKGIPEDITEENIQARTRGVLLMALSNKFGHILLNTSNKSEAATGYGTLYGDMAGGLSVLGDVYKTDVYRLAEYINREGEVIPENTITKPPSA
ncbi:MAG: NAD+ synthase, partial [Bacteroidota bacterium]